VVERILQYRRLYKERRTYVKNYLERMTLNRRIHPEFKQTSTATSRLSSANPNLQNVPARKDATMRSLFIAKDGHTLVRLDWSQLQLRIFAAITKDPVMCDIFARGGDIPQETADLLGIDRKRAKNINFLMLFGGEAWKISNEFHIPLDEAKECIKKYRGRFRQIGEYYAQIKEQAERDHFVTMWTGRKRRLDAMYADDWRVRQKGLREAINTPIQGGEAEIVKITMNALHYKHAAPMILQVHDELIFEIPTQDANEYAHWLKDYVPSIVELEGVRFPVSVGVGQNWFEASKEENEI
jgi:DNA polymerase-1